MRADELDRLIKAGHPPAVLDVRSGLEFRAGHIPGAVHAPMASLLQCAASAAPRKTDRLVLVCEHGPRAQLAGMFLKLRGYKAVELLEGHMASWRTSGRTVKK